MTKSFLLFFLVIELFLSFIFYHYYKIEEEHLKENLFLEMKNYSLFFDDERFDIDIIPKEKVHKLYELYEDKSSLYILIPLLQNKDDLLKIFYPIKGYHLLLSNIQTSILWQFLFLSFISELISMIFSFYVLSPLRQSLNLLEIFIKDIIHDLNTPLTSILINLKMMDTKNEEVESISKSAKAISMLHHNLDAYLKEMAFEKEKFNIKDLIEEQIAFFAPMYDYLQWENNVETLIIKSHRNALARVIYNLISNACKYNTSHGFIKIKIDNNILSISNDSYGIKEPSRVFERFYKESDRGVGIGLHIVEKLCDQLDIPKQLDVKNNIVTISLDLHKVTSK